MTRLSFNHATAKFWDQGEAIEACAREGIGIGLWREPVAEYGLDRTVAKLEATGVPVTTLCRGGFFTTGSRESIEDNRRAVDEAHAVGTKVLVLVSGGLPEGSRDIDGARAKVSDALAELAPYAGAAGVTLAIEPLHPMFASDRCVVSTLEQALDLAAPFPAGQVGAAVDTYHIWWDPNLYRAIARAGAEGRIATFQVADWTTPLPAGVLTGRGQLGTGCVEMRRIKAAVDDAGYDGPIEVELFNDELWARPGAEVFAETVKAYAEHVA